MENKNIQTVQPGEVRFWLQIHSLIVIGITGDAEESRHILLTPQWSSNVSDKPGYETLSLEEITKQFSENRSLTVIAEDPLEGHIYRYNNYGKREWTEVGTTCGYA